MVENIIIAVQALILVLVAIWVHFYQHRVEQIMISETISFYAVEAKFKIGVANRVDAGQASDAKRMLRNVAASNVKWAEEAVNKLDLRMEDLASDAEHSAKILDEVGVSDLSKALQKRKSELRE